MSLTLYISSNCKSPIICDFEFFLRVRSQTQVFVVFAVKGCGGARAVLATERDKKLGIRVHRSIFFEK